jgi:glycosyltransferase involved in cell wall biosynthesis
MKKMGISMPGAPRRPRITVGHSGKQHAYRLASALQGLGHLERFVTSGYYIPDAFPDRLLARSQSLDALFRRRHLPSLDAARVVRRWDLEMPELVLRRLAGGRRLGNTLVCFRDARFDRWSARNWAWRSDLYWGFQGSCFHSLRAARRAGALAVAEFAAVHFPTVEKILAQEAQRHPEWADSLGGLRLPGWYRRRLEAEPHEADFCLVASGFARRSLLDAGIADDRIKVLHLGADLGQFTPVPRSDSGVFRVLFVGKLGQAKGIKYLLEACRRLHSRHIELILVGPIMGSGRALESYKGHFIHRGPVDQSHVIEEMKHSNVLVLPSLLEGFGLVIAEAMATGMPVIASTHSIGPEIIDHGDDGFVLEPDDVEGLAQKIDWMAAHRKQACAMGRAAAVKAQNFSWQAYERRLARIIDDMRKHRQTCFGLRHSVVGETAGSTIP